MSRIVLETRPLGFPWVTADPFLFCVHHDDAYPEGNEQLGPAATLAGRQLGQDFAGKDGWRMYHGRVVPGFPQHPHRGFETVTLVRRGLIDHSDSLGATARFGRGDAQWLTAGDGIVHSEMFPLVERGAPNPLELFQIWLNLPAEDKRVPPHFAMLWNRDIPRRVFTDGAGRTTEVAVVAGTLDGLRPPPPPPRSWAARADTDVAIWTVRMQPGATWTLPAAAGPTTLRTLYFFRGTSMRVGGENLDAHAAVVVRAGAEVPLEAGAEVCELLLLQGRPIAEPVVQYGPFVMNTRTEIQQAMQDYQRTRFGGWPWPADDPVHAREEGRFAKHADGRLERIDD
ncbi:MAG TPA: pirin-like C-terminal cupin domain-containing protein [Polyangiaceae bacterium]|nr:pirin-like C-terminal cupin domain-containing protein [Polyangiaceae bacterium]